jgi:hypothetical protein
VQLWDQLAVLGEQACLQYVGEQVVVAVPGALGVQRDQEQVGALEVLQHRGPIGPAEDRVAQGAGEPVEDGGSQQEVAHSGGLPCKDLVGKVVDDEPVAAGERLDEVHDLGPSRDRAQRQCGELKAGDPALGALFEGIDIGGVEIQLHRLVEELLRLLPGEAEVGTADLDELPAAAQPRQGQWRVGAGGDHQVQLIGNVVEEEGHGLVHVGCSDDVVVVQDEDPLHLRRVFSGAGHGVDQRCESGGRVAGQGLEDRCRLEVYANRFEGRHQVRQEPRQVVVPVVEGEPPGAYVRVSFTQLGDQVAEHGGLPEPSWCRHQRQAMARIKGSAELFSQSGARDGLRAPGRREQLRGEHRSRHSRII